MNTFHLQIVTPDGLMFDGQAQRVLVRTTEGDVGIMSGHSDYVSPVATGETRVTMEDGNVRIVASTFEWAQDIDIERARAAKQRAEEKLAKSSDYEERAAEIKLQRALTRIRVSENMK